MISIYRSVKYINKLKNPSYRCRLSFEKNIKELNKRYFSAESNMKRDLDSITTVDCKFMDISEYFASYLIKDGNSVAIIDTNTNNAVDRLLQALDEIKVSPNQVKYIIVTHKHLDSSGGTSLLASKCKNAQIITNSETARHLIDPSSLIKKTRSLYGNEIYDNIFGEIKPIKEERIRKVEDNERIYLEERPLDIIFVPGHDNHIAVHDLLSKSVFTGHSFGISYKSYFQQYQREPVKDPFASILDRLLFNKFSFNDQSKLEEWKDFIFASSPPSEFDPIQSRNSIERILNLNAERAYLSSFGVWENMTMGLTQLNISLYNYERIMNNVGYKLSFDKISQEEAEEYTISELKEFFREQLISHNISYNEDIIWELLKRDIQLNAQGIVIAANKKKEFYKT